MSGFLEVTYHLGSTPDCASTAWYKGRSDLWFLKLLEEIYLRFRDDGSDDSGVAGMEGAVGLCPAINK